MDRLHTGRLSRTAAVSTARRRSRWPFVELMYEEMSHISRIDVSDARSLPVDGREQGRPAEHQKLPAALTGPDANLGTEERRLRPGMPGTLLVTRRAAETPS